MIGQVALWLIVALAVLPVWIVLANLFCYRRLPRHLVGEEHLPPVSVLIPARNEQENIAAAVKSVLASERR
jgi:cellulose synthase/poly-beta-1,6-N-acetylglucosamine synthase-like glycosyltransferase